MHDNAIIVQEIARVCGEVWTHCCAADNFILQTLKIVKDRNVSCGLCVNRIIKMCFCRLI